MSVGTRTPLSAEEAIDAIHEAYVKIFNRSPVAHMLAILVSQTALETGQWRAIYDYNFGNIRGRYKGSTMSILGANEIIDGKTVIVEDNFRSYPDMYAGAEDFVRFLGTDTTPHNGRANKWDMAFEAAERGDLKAYVFALADPDGNPRTSDGYFTASKDLYFKGIKALYNQFLPMCVDFLGSSTDTDPAELVPSLNAGNVGELASALERVALELSRIADGLKDD